MVLLPLSLSLNSEEFKIDRRRRRRYGFSSSGAENSSEDVFLGAIILLAVRYSSFSEEELGGGGGRGGTRHARDIIRETHAAVDEEAGQCFLISLHYAGLLNSVTSSASNSPSILLMIHPPSLNKWREMRRPLAHRFLGSGGGFFFYFNPVAEKISSPK